MIYPYARARLTVVAVLMAGVSLVVLVQLFRLQIVDHSILRQTGEVRRAYLVAIRPERGRIWDRHGVLLAGNEPRYEMWLDRHSMDTSTLMLTFTPMVGLKPDDVRAALSGAQQVVMLATDLPVAVGERVISETIAGLDVVPYWRRHYPERTLAAHVLGFYTAQHRGYYGLEGFYDQRLAGEVISRTQEQDAWRNPMPLDAPQDAAARPGVDLVLTIDRMAQMIVEDELAAALEATGAEQGAIIAMDPRTGEILAMASAPGFDPNAYTDVAAHDPDRFVNIAISDLYEPGSVFKI
ncbi:MAG TPA: penicillin-binding transpeptidase domain-containing protein, partial [Anaerolineae bacterium]|nr:penicillin-binding transpeptidase domain-containing protein [Anaerolineae bacterium]